MAPASKKRIGIYNKKKNLLVLYKNGSPVYVNANGVISRDTEAIVDCMPAWNGGITI